MNYAALFKYRNKTLGVAINNNRSEASAGFISKLDSKTTMGAEMVYNLDQKESYANLVSVC